MSSSFDPYHQWLGIRDPQRPPNWYRLLGIELFESDADVIESAADRQMAHLRTFQHGPHAMVSQRLLNEISAAKVCLLDSKKKAEYDRHLRSQQPPDLPPIANGEVVDDDEPSVVVDAPRVPLRRPGRGPRRERPWYVSTLFLLPLLALVLCLVAYRVYRDFGPRAPLADAAAGDAMPAPADGSGEVSGAGATDRDGDDEDQAATDVTAGEAPAEPAPEPPEVEPAVTPPPDASRDAPPPSVIEGQTAGTLPGTVPAWDPAALADRGQPARFTTSQPMGAFLLALSQRDLTAADSVLQALRMNQALGLPELLFDEAELVRDALTRFWQAVEAAQATIQPGDQLTLGDLAVTVTERGATSLKLEAPTGQQQAFDLGRLQLHPDLAVALVQHHYASSPATGWQLIATFLAIDHQGDVNRAAAFAEQAELRGFAAHFLTQIVRHLSGDDPSDAPPLSYPPAGLDGTPAGAEPSPEPEKAADLPDVSQQQQARRDVVGPALVELRRQNVPAAQWANELMKRAAEPDLEDAARYVLLVSALKRSKARRDLDTAMAVIDALARDFGQSRADLRYELLQSVPRQVKGDERRRYAELAEQLAREAVRDDNYDDAIRFVSLAQLIGRPLPDRHFRQHLLNARLEIDAIQKAFQTHTSTVATEGDKTSRRDVQAARFRVLSKGDFDAPLDDLRATSELALRKLIEQELVRPATSEQQRSLADGWLEFGQTLSDVEQVNAFRRARHWYDACLANLGRAERTQVQHNLDAITVVLGHDSELFDLTSIPPVAVSVGYGTFGINQNLDAASNPRVEPLPELDGDRVSKFFWACAPSRIEYLVPEGASQFRAIGILNAATQDGVRFVVKADGQEVFASPPVTLMGGRVPIKANLPAGTQALELIVISLKSNVLDHTYWADPQLVFD